MANVDIRVGKKNAAFFSANPTLILKNGQLIFNETTSELFIGDGVTQLSSLVAINGASKWVSGSAGSFSIKADNDSGLDATGDYAVAEGNGTTASGETSHAEGNLTTASGGGSHAEGVQTTASGNASHAEGDQTIASGNASHSEGNGTTASGEASHAGGYLSTASGDYSFVHGNNSTASGIGTVVLGANINGIADDTTYVDKLNVKRDITAQTLTASQIVETDASKNLISAAKNSAYNLNLGTTAGTVLEGNRITQTITNGVTDKAPSEDAVYDALALKGYVQPFGSTAINLAASTSYYWGLLGTALTGGIPLGRASVISKTGILTDVSIYAYVGGTIGSSQNCTIDLIISDMSGIIISTTTLTSTFTFNGANRANIFNASGLNITWTNGYVYTLKLTTGAFTTAPTSVQFSGTFFIKN